MSILPTENDSFGMSVGKSLVTSTVTTIGVLAGFVVVGYAYSKIDQIRRDRQAEKAEK